MDGLTPQDLEYGFPALEQGIDFSLETNCSYLDLLKYEGSNGAAFHNSKGSLDDVGLQAWLAKDITRSLEHQQADPAQESCIGGLRLLFGHCTLDAVRSCRVLPFREPTFPLIEQKIKIPSQFFQSMRDQTGYAFRVSNPSSDNIDESHSTSFLFKFGIFQPAYYQITLNYSPVTNLTYGLIIAKTRDHDFETIIRSLEQRESLITHPLLLPVLVADLSIASSTKRIHTANWLLNEVEEMTGQHQWINRPIGDPFKLDYTATIRKINTVSRTLSVEARRVNGALVNMNRIIHESEKLIIASDSPDSRIRDLRDNSAWLKEMVDNHRDRCQHLSTLAEHIQKQVQTQISVVYQFMAQKDSKVHIELTKATAVIARESKKDSSAMKAIAVLTMCFLPGTFLAALFALPLFNWDEGNFPVVKKGFKYYWAIAIPLTILVLVIWAVAVLLPWKRWRAQFLCKTDRSDVEAANGERLKDE